MSWVTVAGGSRQPPLQFRCSGPLESHGSPKRITQHFLVSVPKVATVLAQNLSNLPLIGYTVAILIDLTGLLLINVCSSTLTFAHTHINTERMDKLRSIQPFVCNTSNKLYQLVVSVLNYMPLLLMKFAFASQILQK